MKTSELESMSVAKLWELHEQVAAELSGKILAEKKTLEERLRRLEGGGLRLNGEAQKTRRSYPKVYPKYRNPRNRSETWAGRGKQPRWLVAQLRSGKKLEDFQIKRP